MPSYLERIRDRVGHDTIPLVFTSACIRGESGDVLWQRRADFGWWGLPGGILLQRGPDGKTWELPCVPLELGERIDQTLVRGLRHTIGVNIAVVRLVGVYSNEKAIFGLSAVKPLSLLFLCKDEEGVTPGGRPSSREIAFFPSENLPIVAERYDLLIRDARSNSDGTIF